MINKTILFTCMATILTGCGGGTGSGNLAEYSGLGSPTAEPVAGAALPVSSLEEVIAAANGVQTSAQPSNVVGEQPQEAGASINAATLASPYVESIATNSEELVTIPDSDSSGLITNPDFLFDTAKTVRLKVDLSDSIGTQGVLSVCTEFQETASGFDVNYDKCPIRGTIANGQFEKDMSLMNQFDSAIAVIWYRNQELEPRYKAFNTADIVQGSDSQEWVWN